MRLDMGARSREARDREWDMRRGLDGGLMGGGVYTRDAGVGLGWGRVPKGEGALI